MGTTQASRFPLGKEDGGDATLSDSILQDVPKLLGFTCHPAHRLHHGVTYSAAAGVLRAIFPSLDVALTQNIYVIPPGPAFHEKLRPWDSLLAIKLEEKSVVWTKELRMALGHILFSQSLL